MTNKLSAVLVAGVLTTGLAMAAPANAQSVTVGNGSTIGRSILNNVVTNPAFPTTSYPRYQQVYGASAFTSQGITGPIPISSLTFFAATQECGFFGCFAIPVADQSIAAGDYTIRLSTTSRAVDGLGDNFNSNWGADVQNFFVGVMGGNTLTITGQTAFMYDPTMGNLLLDITVHSQTGNGGYLMRDAESSAQFNNPANRDQMSSRIGTNTTTAVTTGLPFTRSGGYKTEFGYASAITTTPEPGTWALLGTGMLVLGGIGIRQRRRMPTA